MVFIIDLINDSVLLSSMEDFNEFSPQELYEKYGEEYLYNITNILIKDYTKLEKIYNDDYNFTDEELWTLIDQLSYIDNKYLIDMIVFSKYKRSEFIKNNLNEDLSKIYNECGADDSIFKEFIKRKNISILKYINKIYNIQVDENLLNHCCKVGNLEIFKWLSLLYLEKIYNNYFLIPSSASGNIEIVKYLLDNGTNIHHKRDKALIIASRFGHTETVKLLLDKGANIHAINDCALKRAAENNFIKTVKLLLDRGANIHKTHDNENLSNYDNALSLSCQNGHTDIVRLLLDKGENIRNVRDWSISQVFRDNHVETVKLLFDRGIAIHIDCFYFLIISIEKSNIEMVKLLIDGGVDINKDDDFALRVAVHYSNMEIIKLIIDKGGN